MLRLGALQEPLRRGAARACEGGAAGAPPTSLPQQTFLSDAAGPMPAYYVGSSSPIRRAGSDSRARSGEPDLVTEHIGPQVPIRQVPIILRAVRSCCGPVAVLYWTTVAVLLLVFRS